MTTTRREHIRTFALPALALFCLQGLASDVSPLQLSTSMLKAESDRLDIRGLVDEQLLAVPPWTGKPTNGWKVASQHWKEFPFAFTLDLGAEQPLAALHLFDTNGEGETKVSVGQPGQWKEVARHDGRAYQRWTTIPLQCSTRFLRFELMSAGANCAEIALEAFTPEGWATFQRNAAAAARLKTERDAALQRAAAEAAQRPVLDLPPFGRVSLVDEIDCGAADPAHQFRESPAGVSRVEQILDRPCRVLAATTNESAYMAFRLGRWKLLKPGASYVLAVDYPEDRPRSVIVMNGGNETARGFHTGTTLGDALHAKYVNGNPESLRAPLSGRHEAWTLFFPLHDRFPDLGFLRGPKERPLTAEDGFDVVIAQFSARNDPTSAGAAVSRIRLFEVLDAKVLARPLVLPPAPLPHRRLFWREEMADGVIESDRETERGVKDRLDWYRFKAAQMRFLGFNTYTKDLLEFGACQHWDPTPHGGNAWVHFAGGTKDLWAQIVGIMGAAGFDILPYYEYAGSKGGKGLGYERRAKPLTRDDAFTHIKWIESANADLTDPDTLADFQKMVDLTVVRLRDRAHFAGVWLRPRSQLPMGFSDATRARFAAEANGNKAVTRAQLIADKDLLARYEAWWLGRRRDFLSSVRSYLATNGVAEATVLYTTDSSEPGVSFPTWEKRLATDDPAAWRDILAQPVHQPDGKAIVPMPIERVVAENQFLEALQASPLTWGGWEVHHASPGADPSQYRATPGVLLTHGFNRRYTVASPATFDAFRGPAGLALVRHHALNENMLFDAKDAEKLGYFVADFERAGPACMMAEVLAVANGDPTMIGYLHGGNFGRGFPAYVRDFNANFLALPALPSERLQEASDDPDIVVRAIRTKEHGTWYAVVNTGWTAKSVAVRVPGVPQLDLHPFALRTIHVP